MALIRGCRFEEIMKDATWLRCDSGRDRPLNVCIYVVSRSSCC